MRKREIYMKKMEMFFIYSLFWLIAIAVYITGNTVSYGEEYRVKKIISVYDGDTFRVALDDCRIPVFCDSIPIRLSGIDCPEKRGTKGYEKQLALKAKRLTASYLSSAKSVHIRSIKRGKYFRVIAEVIVDGENLATILLNSGFAKPYNGLGKRPTWTQDNNNEIL